MITIYKYELQVVDEQEIEMYDEYKLLSVIEQNGKIVVYALINTDSNPRYNVKFIMRGTGHNAEKAANLTFLGTVKLLNGLLIYHIFY